MKNSAEGGQVIKRTRQSKGGDEAGRGGHSMATIFIDSPRAATDQEQVGPDSLKRLDQMQVSLKN